MAWQAGLHGHSWARLVPVPPRVDAVIQPSLLQAGLTSPAPEQPQCQAAKQETLPSGLAVAVGAVHHTCDHTQRPSEVPGSGPARHRDKHLPRAPKHCQCHLVLPSLTDLEQLSRVQPNEVP